MKAIWLVVALIAFPAAAMAAGEEQAGDGCTACHLESGEPRLMKPVEDFKRDIHRAKGLGCASCHGGDPKLEDLEAMNPAKGFVGVPPRKKIPEFCGRCHSDADFMKRYDPSLRVDQVAEYRTSVHGERLEKLDDPKVATCVSCHTAHSIMPPSDPRSTVYTLRVASLCGGCHANRETMAGYDIPTDQLAKYEKSVHWTALSVKGDLSAPTCNDCHGNHGAVPPGVKSVANVCGQCHSVVEETFAKSVHATAFVALGTPGCANCHGNHEIEPATDDMLGVGPGTFCSRCHDPDDQGGKVAATMRGLIDDLKSEDERAREILHRAELAGMEVSRPQFDLDGAREALVKARVAIHAALVAPVKEDIDNGLAIARAAYRSGIDALKELRFRRTGLAVSLVIIVALIAALVMKIRDIERKPGGGPRLAHGEGPNG